MPTINVSTAAYSRVVNQSSHNAARGASTGQSTNITGQAANAFSYVAASGGRGLSYSIYRTFLYFDTTAITGTVSAASVNVLGYSSGGGRRILVPSTAFGGDGQSAITGGDYSNLSFNTNYNNNFNGWNTSSNNVFTLKSTAFSDMQTNNYFICAVIEYDHDYSNSAPASAISNIFGVNANVSSNIYLDYTLTGGGGGPAGVAEVDGIATADINNWDGTVWGDIDSINGIT
jgi:hypothetical protein